MQPIYNGAAIAAIILAIAYGVDNEGLKTRLAAIETQHGLLWKEMDAMTLSTASDWYSSATTDHELSERLENLEALKSSAIQYGSAAKIRVMDSDTVVFGRWEEPKEDDAK